MLEVFTNAIEPNKNNKSLSKKKGRSKTIFTGRPKYIPRKCKGSMKNPL
jgi:hypothetical protein